ncbi:MAG TPA: 50S ribosomal protein L11 methyltransferase [Chitinophagaceae bacterium]
MSNYIKIEIETVSAVQMEILIAELSEIHFDAFEENENCLSAFIKEGEFKEEQLKEILSSKNISYAKQVIKETNWNAKWESEFEPIIVDNFVAVRAAFHKPIEGVKHEIIITPKMSFGTGHHATTYLMLQQMENIGFLNKTVLDFGTGTGILAILAKKLGAKKVVAIDNDEWSINNAKENFIANNCTDIILLQKDNLDGLERFDIILANINLNVITANSKQIKLASHQSAKLLLSGFLSDDEQTLKNNFISEDFTHVKTREKNGWISVLLTKS